MAIANTTGITSTPGPGSSRGGGAEADGAGTPEDADGAGTPDDPDDAGTPDDADGAGAADEAGGPGSSGGVDVPVDGVADVAGEVVEADADAEGAEVTDGGVEVWDGGGVWDGVGDSVGSGGLMNSTLQPAFRMAMPSAFQFSPG